MNKIDLKFGFLCNNKCRFCVQGNKREKYGNFPTKDLEKKLKSTAKECNKIVFTGGEVTIREDFFYLLKLAKKLGYKSIQIQSNGRIFSNMEFCEETIDAGATEFSLALHGHVPELHDYLTETKNSFYQTVKGIKNLKTLNQYVGTNTVITRSNYRNLPDIARLLVYLNVDQYQFAFVHALGTALENFNNIVPRYSLIESYVKNGLEIGIRANKTVMTEAIPYCFMDGYTDYIAEKIMPRTKIVDVKIVNDYTEYRLREGKSKGIVCRKCVYNDICEGPWKEYPEKYGWDEFKYCEL